MKQWIKYAAVVMAFMMMAGFFLPDFKAQVRATEVTVTEDGTGEVTPEEGENSDIIPGEDGTQEISPWTVIVHYKLDQNASEDFHTVEQVSSQVTGGYEDVIQIPLLKEEPDLENHYFLGWVCETNDGSVEIGETDIYVSRGEEEEKNVVLVAQWEEYENLVFAFDQANGEITEDKRYKGTDETELEIKLPEVSAREGLSFTGWLCDFDSKVYMDGVAFQWKNLANTSKITFTAQWEWDGSLITSEMNSYNLSQGVAYRLAENMSWSVNNDGYAYTGGITFYVAEEGTYSFQGIVMEQ